MNNSRGINFFCQKSVNFVGIPILNHFRIVYVRQYGHRKYVCIYTYLYLYLCGLRTVTCISTRTTDWRSETNEILRTPLTNFCGKITNGFVKWFESVENIYEWNWYGWPANYCLILIWHRYINVLEVHALYAIWLWEYGVSCLRLDFRSNSSCPSVRYSVDYHFARENLPCREIFWRDIYRRLEAW